MSKAKSYDNYPPLELLKKVTGECPYAWKTLEFMHNHRGMTNPQNGVRVPDWPDWCYLPMGASMALAQRIVMQQMQKKVSIESLMSPIEKGQQIAALAVWRTSKEVFVLDEDMEQLLAEQSDKLDIPMQILMQLPYPGFYIQFNNLYLGKKKYHGTFVHLEYDPKTHDSELRFLFLDEDLHTLGFHIFLDAKDVEESLQLTVKDSTKNIEGIKDEKVRSILQRGLNIDPEYIQGLEAFLRYALQAVLYICASNAEITPNKEQETMTKRSKTGEVRDRYSEIRKWDVGVRIGNAVRVHDAETKKEPDIGTEEVKEFAPGSHTPKRPHIRRGHWHNYWTGKMDDTENRKLILKWTAPTFIGLSDEDDSPAVIHNIKS